MNAEAQNLLAGFVFGATVMFVLMMGWWMWLLGVLVGLFLICYAAEWWVYREAAHWRMIGGNMYRDKD